MSVRSLSGLALAIALVAGMALTISGANAAVPGCGAVESVTERDSAFTPWEGRFGYSPERPIERVGVRVSDASLAEAVPFKVASPGISLPVQVRLLVNLDDVNGDGITEPSLRTYYSASAWTSSTTLTEFLESGGVVFEQSQAAGVDAEYIAAALGSRATMVAIGSYQGALVHADPISAKGTRPYYLTWSDGTVDAQLIGDVSPSAIIGWARSIYCQS